MYPSGVPVAFDWSEYLNLAQELLEHAASSRSPEAYYRASISRAYFAAHCKARNYLRDVKGDILIPQTGSAHQYVIDKFRNSSDRRCRSVGQNLDRMRIDRTFADYQDIVPGLSKMASSSVRMGIKVFSTLTEIRINYD